MLSEVNQTPRYAKLQFYNNITIPMKVVLFTDILSATYSKRAFFHVIFGKTFFLYEKRNSVRTK